MIRKILKIAGLVVLMILASIGIGITGAAPPPSKTKETNRDKANTELVEEQDEENDMAGMKIQ